MAATDPIENGPPSDNPYRAPAEKHRFRWLGFINSSSLGLLIGLAAGAVFALGLLVLAVIGFLLYASLSTS